MPAPTAQTLDATDPLRGFAGRFSKPPGGIYLDGNSLGLVCRPAEESLAAAVAAWRDLAIRGWTEGPAPWFDLPRRAAGLLAPLVGAAAEDVAVGGTTTANLHQLLATFLPPVGPGSRVLIDGTAFPSDRYAVESHLRLRGRDPAADLVVVPPGPARLLDEAAVLDRLSAGVGFAVLPAVVYTTGQLLDLPGLTRAARARGVLVAWDCSHSAGVVPHAFRADGIDLAFGGTYKYLNGGPGSPGWLYVHPRLRDRLPGLAGWFGSDPARQFEMLPEFHPAADANRYQVGTPHVLSLAPLVGALEVVAEAGVPALRAKSLRQTAFLRELVDARLARLGVRVVTPTEDARRGGHLTIAHPDGAKLSRALRARGVVPDFRPPDMVRLAPAPLYTTFGECERAVEVLEELLRTGDHLSLADAHAPVT